MQVRFRILQLCVSVFTSYCAIHLCIRSAFLLSDRNYWHSVLSENSTNMFRPRGSFARAMYNKHLSDMKLEQLDRSVWYHVNLEALHPVARQIFVPSSLDPETEQFLNRCVEKSDNILTQLWHAIVKTLLILFMSQTDINGLLGRGSMFVFSQERLESLLDRPLGQDGDLIDLGAGDGLVTKVLSNFYSRVCVTEMSKTMRWTLKKRGFRILEVDGWANKQYDAVSCLNLLDRCDKPLTILQQIKQALKPDGRVIIALVLPLHQYVESRKPDHQPLQWLPIKGTTFEEQVSSFILDVLNPAGFVVEKWTKLPYICEGDINQAYYWLDDAVFIATPRS